MERKLADALVRLEASGIDTARLDAELLLSHVLRTNRAGLIARRGEPLTLAQQASFNQLVERRVKREPIAYILGTKEFYGRDFKVTPSVLIPRPETEQLVELVVKRANLLHKKKKTVFIADIGCGSGAIGITLAAELSLSVLLTDISDAALTVARKNAEQLGVSKLTRFECSNLLDYLKSEATQSYDELVIAANLPYIAEGDLLPADVKDYEPASALFSGVDGLNAIGRLIAQAANYRPKIRLFLEHGHGSRFAIKQMAQRHGFSTADYDDLAGLERIMELW